MTPYILVLYYSRNGATRQLAHAVALGIEKVSGIDAMLRTVPAVSAVTHSAQPSIPEHGDIYCSSEELKNCAGLALGSPTRFGNMAAPMKHFLDGTSEQWLNGDLIGKPAGAFSSTSSLHGGQETTLISMIVPLLHQGMIIAGVPYSEDALHTTTGGGTPYGPTHHTAGQQQSKLSNDETRICDHFGQRLARLALALKDVKR